jgi:hypothetical protein
MARFAHSFSIRRSDTKIKQLVPYLAKKWDNAESDTHLAQGVDFPARMATTNCRIVRMVALNSV